MSSSGECELDSEPTPVSSAATATSMPKMVESSGKKTVYTRKKSTSAMQRKISAELGIKNVHNTGDGKEKEADEESDCASSCAIIKSSTTSDKYLSPRVAHPPSSRPHYHRHHYPSNSLRKHVLVRRSPSPSASLSPGYEQYQMALLEVPLPRDYAEASSDDLSSEWDSDAPDSRSRFIGNFKVKDC